MNFYSPWQHQIFWWFQGEYNSILLNSFNKEVKLQAIPKALKEYRFLTYNTM